MLKITPKNFIRSMDDIKSRCDWCNEILHGDAFPYPTLCRHCAERKQERQSYVEYLDGVDTHCDGCRAK